MEEELKQYSLPLECPDMAALCASHVKKLSELINRMTIELEIPEFAIGSDGILLEWDIERKEVEPGHAFREERRFHLHGKMER